VTRDGISEATQENESRLNPVSGRRTRNYVLAVLTLVYVFNFIDRQILVILQESIKEEMGLSDKQLGLLSGFAFAVFYVSFGIPIARWADRFNRRNIVAASLGAWSVMTATCGMVQSYTQLVLARIGVGIGEAGGSPPSHSIISDYFPFSKRATALSIYSVGIYIGIMLGYLGGGWVNEYFGWRMAFFVVAVPGVLLAVVVRLTIREPLRGMSDNLAKVDAPPPFGEAMRKLWNFHSFRYICLGSAFAAFVGYGVGNFAPSYFIRLHGLSSGEVGTYLALIAGICGGLGTFLGGYLSDRMGKRDVRWYLWVPAAGLIIGLPLRTYGYITEDFTLAIALLAVAQIFDALYLAPSIAACHGLVSPRMRALASSVLFFVLNIIGLGLGPFMVGWASDLLQPKYGVESLRWAIVLASLGILLAIAAYLRGAYHFKREIETR
jgi:MFS family permease